MTWFWVIQPHPDLAGKCQTSFVTLAEQQLFCMHFIGRSTLLVVVEFDLASGPMFTL